jgi:hypothetical protein
VSVGLKGGRRFSKSTLRRKKNQEKNFESGCLLEETLWCPCCLQEEDPVFFCRKVERGTESQEETRRCRVESGQHRKSQKKL